MYYRTLTIASVLFALLAWVTGAAAQLWLESHCNLIRLASGRLALLWNRLCPEGRSSIVPGGSPDFSERQASWQREELSLAFSTDDAKTWTKPVVIGRSRGWIELSVCLRAEARRVVGHHAIPHQSILQPEGSGFRAEVVSKGPRHVNSR